MRTILKAASVALNLAFAGAAVAATPHESHVPARLELSLNKGQKWQTDEPLRAGMIEIRSAVAASLPRVHAGTYSAADYAGLAAELQNRIDFIIGNCKLPEEADAQLHVVLEHILDGIGELKGAAEPAGGAMQIVRALNAYGDHFDHPGWSPIAH